jgi:flavin-dependent dehydrogenase
MTTCDIVVLGGGVAGCIVAAGLARTGRAVTLIAQLRDETLFEGQSPRTADDLKFAGFGAALTSAGPWVERYSYWNGECVQVNGETLVNRRRFDAALLEDARGASVDVRLGRVATVDRSRSGWRVLVMRAGAERTSL